MEFITINIFYLAGFLPKNPDTSWVVILIFPPHIIADLDDKPERSGRVLEFHQVANFKIEVAHTNTSSVSCQYSADAADVVPSCHAIL